MFNKDSFIHYHAANARTGFTPTNSVYEGFVQDAEGKPWGFIKSLNLYEQQQTGIRMDPAEFQRYNIDILGYGSNDGGTSNRPTGSPYMYDPQGVALQMYSGDANVLILGDSVHNWNVAFTEPSTGHQPLISSYTRKWQPARWSGMGIPQTYGSSGVGARTNTSGGGTDAFSTRAEYTPGENANALYKNYVTSNSLFASGLGSDNPATTWLTSDNGTYMLTRLQFATETTGTNPGERLDSGQYYVGRNQIFDDSAGGTESTCWFNQSGDQLTIQHTFYLDAIAGVNAIHARSQVMAETANYTYLNEQGLTRGAYNTISLNTATATTDELGTDPILLNIHAAGAGTQIANCWTRVYNDTVKNGMELTYAGAGGWEFANHGSTQASDAPTADGITNAWYNDDAITQQMTDFETNIVYVYITNAAAGGVEDDRAGLRKLVNRINDNYSSTGLGGTVKIVFVAPHPNHGSDDAGLARRNMILEECRSLGVGYIDLYGYLKDNGVTESTVKDTYGYLVDSYHPGATGADYFAEKIWDIVTEQASV